jgi:spore coat protein U-like protein
MSKKLIFSIVFIFSISVFADCRFIVDSPIIFTNLWNEKINLVEEITIEKSISSKSCDGYAFYFSRGNSNNYDRKAKSWKNYSINYNLFKNNNMTGVLKDRPDVGNESEFIFGNFLSNTKIKIPFYFNIPMTSEMLPSGMYSDEIILNTYSFNSQRNTYLFESGKVIPVRIEIPKMINVSLLNVGDTFDPSRTSKVLDFGELYSGKELSLAIKVASNSGFRVYLSSMNDGYLRNMYSGQKIDYLLFVKNEKINLSHSSIKPVLFGQNCGTTGHEGKSFETRVKIGNINEKKDGVYEDYITVTAITND